VNSKGGAVNEEQPEEELWNGSIGGAVNANHRAPSKPGRDSLAFVVTVALSTPFRSSRK